MCDPDTIETIAIIARWVPTSTAASTGHRTRRAASRSARAVSCVCFKPGGTVTRYYRHVALQSTSLQSTDYGSLIGIASGHAPF